VRSASTTEELQPPAPCSERQPRNPMNQPLTAPPSGSP